MLQLLLLLLAVSLLSAFLVCGIKYAVMTEGVIGRIVLIITPIITVGGVSGLMGMTIYGV